jgi:hypothetical protein
VRQGGAVAGYSKPPSNEQRGWTPALREFVQGQQERKYRKLADALGLGDDPAAAYVMLSNARLLDDEQPERLRRRGYYSACRPQEWARYMRSLNDTVKPYYEAELPTLYEHPEWYPAMMVAFDEMGGGGLNPPPLLATMPSGDFNAHVLAEPRSGVPVVFFEQGLFQFLDDFAWLAAWAIPPVTPQQISDDRAIAALPTRYVMPPTASELFAGVLCSYVVHGNAAHNRDWENLPRPEHNLQLHSALVSCMEYFSMAHEFSHIRNGEVGTPAGGTRQSWAREYEADRGGAGYVSALIEAKLGPQASALGFFGCYLALTAMHFLMRTLAFFAFGPLPAGQKLSWTSTTHPDPLTRRDYLRSEFTNAPDTSPAGAWAAHLLCTMSDTLFQGLSEIMVMSSYPMYRQGMRPSPLWNDTIRSCLGVGGA